MNRPCIKDMFEGRQSKYSLVIGIAKRARIIASDAERNGEIIIEKPVSLAIQDFKDDKYIILEPEINE